MTVILSFPKKKGNSSIGMLRIKTFCIVWITIVNNNSENKATFQEYWMTFPCQ